MGGGLTDWHRQKRKKEQQKNKQKRIAERDAKVLETKSAVSVQDEIRKIERQHKVKKDEQGNDIPLPHAIKSKLDRLKKELKILKESEEKAGEKQGSSSTTNQPSKEQWKPMENPELSVYYDPVMNPFGEPPPGKPRLYHTAKGGTTFYIEEAALPGSRPPEIKQSATNHGHHGSAHPLPTHTQPSQPHTKQIHSNAKMPREKHTYQKESHRTNQHAPKESTASYKSRGEKHSLQSSIPSLPSSSSTAKSSIEQTQKRIPPQVAPDLPAPSQAVRRGRSRLKADIWATNEEIEYHEQTDDPQTQITLEGVETATAASETLVKEWWYEDQQTRIQGPFPHEQMLSWIKAGYFPPETRARSRPNAPWKPFHHYPAIRAILPGAHGGSSDITNEKEEEQSLADRIQALRAQHKQTSIEDRLAALRGDSAPPLQNTSRSSNPRENKGKDVEQSDFEEAAANFPGGEYLPPPPQVTSQMFPPYDIGDTKEDSLPPPPPPPSSSGVTHDPAQKNSYHIGIDVDGDSELLPPPPPPAQGEFPAYAIGDLSVYQDVEPYPDIYATVDYPVSEEYVESDAPVIDRYGDEETGKSGDAAKHKPPLKKLKVDRQVVSFLPTNLRKMK